MDLLGAFLFYVAIRVWINPNAAGEWYAAARHGYTKYVVKHNLRR